MPIKCCSIHIFLDDIPLLDCILNLYIMWNLLQKLFIQIFYFHLLDRTVIVIWVQIPGSGSCGMGVIMSVNSIMNGPLATLPAFHWKFNDMHIHRRLLFKTVFEMENRRL